jgi:hypothetical protein
MQLTIFHQLIGLPCKCLGKNGIVVDVCFIGGEPHVMIHTQFEKASLSHFHSRKWIYSIIYSVEEFNNQRNGETSRINE